MRRYAGGENGVGSEDGGGGFRGLKVVVEMRQVLRVIQYSLFHTRVHTHTVSPYGGRPSC